MSSGAQPVGEALAMPAFEDLTKASFSWNGGKWGSLTGGPGMASGDGVAFPWGSRMRFMGKGTRELVFRSDSGAEPAKFYFNSVYAHAVYPPALIPHQAVAPLELGEHATANRRNIYQHIVTSWVQTLPAGDGPDGTHQPKYLEYVSSAYPLPPQ
ncbi:MAG: hypothetical protein IPK21_15420 [Haliscomenobacter sp.]|nr:hypothetical protein [Haliscomenobacter sp.]